MLKNKFFDFSTKISKNTIVHGHISSKKSISIEGEVEGNVATEQHLKLHANGIVRMNIQAKDADIQGKVKGNIQVENGLDLSESSIIHGNIQCRQLRVHKQTKLLSFQDEMQSPIIAEEKKND